MYGTPISDQEPELKLIIDTAPVTAKNFGLLRLRLHNNGSQLC